MSEIEDEDLLASLPRSETLEGDDLTIAAVHPDGSVVITDGERKGVYRRTSGASLRGPDLRIVPMYVEAGWFSEARVVKLTDGKRQALYEPASAARGSRA